MCKEKGTSEKLGAAHVVNDWVLMLLQKKNERLHEENDKLLDESDDYFDKPYV